MPKLEPSPDTRIDTRTDTRSSRRGGGRLSGPNGLAVATAVAVLGGAMTVVGCGSVQGTGRPLLQDAADGGSASSPQEAAEPTQAMPGDDAN